MYKDRKWNGMVVAKDSGWGDGKLQFSRCRVSVMQNEKSFGGIGGDSHETVNEPNVTSCTPKNC
jgi:hypothetical protein